MKTHVAVYKTREEATIAIEKLNKKKFPIEKVSILERADTIERHIKVKSIATAKIVPILIFSTLGLIIGILSPLLGITFGLEFMKDVPLFVSAFFGFDVGLLVGGIVVIIIAIIMKRNRTIEGEKHIESSLFLIVIDGNNKDVIEAENILNTEGTHNHKLVCTYCKAKNAS